MSVLLLNASYEPMKAITVRHAFELLYDGKAHAVEGLTAVLRSPSTRFEIPSVIRLKVYVNAPRRKLRWTKRGVLIRDDYTCIYCGVKPGDKKNRKKNWIQSDFSVEHIKPQSKGGRDSWTNTACACKPCNTRKGDKMPHEIGLKLGWEPKTPRADTIVFRGSIPVEWKRYLVI